jgi:3-oxoacid CoA-transferase
MISKVTKDPKRVFSNIKEGSTIMLGGFGLCGIPENGIAYLLEAGVKNLTCISNNAGVDDFGIGLLLKNRLVKKMISSYVGENQEFERQLLAGELEVDLIPQGTLSERIRAGGAGIPAFYTPAGVNTEIEEGKEIRTFNAKKYLLEYGLTADFALVKAWKGDTAGNLVFKGTARNLNPMMAAAGKVTIVEVEILVQAGELHPNDIHVPGVYVQHIFEGKNYSKRIEQRTVASNSIQQSNKSDTPKIGEGITKEQIAIRISRELKDGYYVNLGIGIPTLIANYIPKNVNVVLQSENGLLGIGPFPEEKHVDADLINAGKQTVSLLPGSALFNSAESFAMIRGGHIDLTVLGAMEVSENGDIANWKIPNKMVKGMGGAMDLVASAKNIIVAMQHTSKSGKSKLLKSCSLPLTGKNCIKKIVTELAVLEISPSGGFKLVERAPGISVEQIKHATEGKLIIEGDIPEMQF